MIIISDMFAFLNFFTNQNLFVKVYQDLIYGQNPSLILNEQAKHITCIILILILVNIWLI